MIKCQPPDQIPFRSAVLQALPFCFYSISSILAGQGLLELEALVAQLLAVSWQPEPAKLCAGSCGVPFIWKVFLPLLCPIWCNRLPWLSLQGSEKEFAFPCSLPSPSSLPRPSYGFLFSVHFLIAYFPLCYRTGLVFLFLMSNVGFFWDRDCLICLCNLVLDTMSFT